MDVNVAEEIVKKHLREQSVTRKEYETAKTSMINILTSEAYNNFDYEWSLNDFKLGRFLGGGKFGRVYEAIEKRSQYPVAIKTMSKKEIVNGNVERQVLREIEIQSHLKHPNILRLFTWFHDNFRIYLVIEFATEGELYKHLKNSPHGRFDSRRSARYVYQVADALEYCHQNSVMHRDIKPENLLLTSNDNVLLSDFGWSVHAPSLKRKTMCGTLDYLPPEMVDKESYTIHVDQWCLGILCYEFLVGSPPFESEDEKLTYEKIKNLRVAYPQFMDSGAKDLISKLLKKQGAYRLSLQEVKHHPWIIENTSEYQQ